MEFGKHNNPEQVAFNLPFWNHSEICRLSRTENLELFIGSTSWNQPNWRGSIYPSKIQASDTLRYYTNQFNSIELNSTFYGMPNEKVWHSWMERANSGFKFVVKTPQSISASTLGPSNLEAWQIFIDRCAPFYEKIGMIFYQFPTRWRLESIMTKLEKILKYLPEKIPVHFEIRALENRNCDVLSNISSMFSESDSGLVITDTPGFRDLVHMRLFSSDVMLRFVSCGVKEIDELRLQQWCERILEGPSNGLKRFFFFIHDHENYQIPVLALSLLQYVKGNDRIITRGPALISGDKQMTLF